MSNGMIIFLAFLSFIVLNGLVEAIRERGGPTKREREAALEVKTTLDSVEQSLRDVRERLTSIEGILRQVE